MSYVLKHIMLLLGVIIILRPLMWEHKSYNYFMEKDRKTIDKMYPGADFENKYILFMQFDLLWKYKSDILDVYIEVLTEKDIVVMPRYKTKNIYPNKNYYVACMFNGNKAADNIPLIFNSYDDISKVKKIMCRWKISYEVNNKRHIHCIQIIYNTSFIKDSADKKKIYSLHSRETDIDYLFSAEAKSSIFKGISKFDEYEKILQIINIPQDQEFKVNYIKGCPLNKSDISVDCLNTTFDNISIKDLNENPHLPLIIDSYSSSEILEPDIASKFL